MGWEGNDPPKVSLDDPRLQPDNTGPSSRQVVEDIFNSYRKATTSATETAEQTQPQERMLQEVFSKLPEDERKSLLILRDLYPKALEQLDIQEGGLAIVGGVIDKPWPRKDIDFIDLSQVRTNGPFRNRLEEARAQFETTKKITEIMSKIDPKFKIEEVIEPSMMEDLQNPNILKHDGKVVVRIGESQTAMNFMRGPNTGNVTEALASRQRPYSILTQVRAA